jgi:hypothetical protein
MSTKLNRLSLNGNSVETLFESEDFVFSIAFCKATNGVFYSNFSENNISMFDLGTKDVILYKKGDTLSPKSICLSENHEKLFFEDSNDGISGFYVKSALVFSRTNCYSILEIESHQNSRNVISQDPTDMRTKANCIEYLDDSNRVLISRHKKHSIDYIEDSGKIYRFIGSGKPDFCSSTNPLNVSFNCPTGLGVIDFASELWVADTNNHIVRCFSKNNKWKELRKIGVPTKEGEQDGCFNKALFRFPSEICNFDRNIFVIDNGNKIRKIDAGNHSVSTFYSTDNFIKSITCDQENVYWVEIKI